MSLKGMLKKKEQEPVNLLELKPARNVEWETREGGLVVLLVPKFRNRLVLKWFVPMLAKPKVRVKLDELGSAVWARCDGATTVEKIGEEMAKVSGEPLDAAYQRIGKFIQQLARHEFVVVDSSEAKS